MLRSPTAVLWRIFKAEAGCGKDLNFNRVWYNLTMVWIMTRRLWKYTLLRLMTAPQNAKNVFTVWTFNLYVRRAMVLSSIYCWVVWLLVVVGYFLSSVMGPKMGDSDS